MHTGFRIAVMSAEYQSGLVMGESVMRTVRENAPLLLAAATATKSIFDDIAEAIYRATLRRALRSIARFG
jgi:hypothetical protein